MTIINYNYHKVKGTPKCILLRLFLRFLKSKNCPIISEQLRTAIRNFDTHLAVCDWLAILMETYRSTYVNYFSPNIVHSEKDDKWLMCYRNFVEKYYQKGFLSLRDFREDFDFFLILESEEK